MKRPHRGNRSTNKTKIQSPDHREPADGREKQTSRRDRSSHSRRWWIAAVLAAAILIGFAWWKFQAVPKIAIPEIVLQDAAPDVQRAVATARDMVAAAPHSPSAWGEFGMLLFAHQFESEANACLAQAERLDPSDVRWPYLLGVSLAVSDPQVAERHFRRALQLQDFPAVHLRLGELLLRSEDLAAALEQFNSAYRADREDPRTLDDLARVCLAQRNLTAARQWAEQAVQLAPDTKSVRELLATILQQLGERESALRQLQEADQAAQVTLGWKDPIASSVMAMRRDVTSLLEHAQDLLDAGEVQQGIDVLSQSLRVDDREPRVYIQLAKALINANQLPQAYDVLQRAESRHPQVAEIRFQRGNSEFFMQRWEAAEKSFRAALTLQPNFSLAHYNLGHVLLKLDRKQEALESFEAAARLRPEYSDAHVNAAKLYLEQGNREKARRHLQDANRSKPGDREIKQIVEQANEGK